MDKVVHFELPVKNMKRAEMFYKEMFGWSIVDTGMHETKGIYTLPIRPKKIKRTA